MWFPLLATYDICISEGVPGHLMIFRDTQDSGGGDRSPSSSELLSSSLDDASEVPSEVEELLPSPPESSLSGRLGMTTRCATWPSGSPPTVLSAAWQTIDKHAEWSLRLEVGGRAEVQER